MKLTSRQRKVIMNSAWVTARAGAEKFGGKASDYLSESLKMVWALYRKGKAKHMKEQEIKKHSVEVKEWFVNKEIGMMYNEINKVVKETEKAVLIDFDPMRENPEIRMTQWVPKSCLSA